MKLRSHAMHVYTYLDGEDGVAALQDLVEICGALEMPELPSQGPQGARSSGPSEWPWADTACCAATSSNSFSSPMIVSVQLLSLSKRRQSAILRILVLPWAIARQQTDE